MSDTAEIATDSNLDFFHNLVFQVVTKETEATLRSVERNIAVKSSVSVFVFIVAGFLSYPKMVLDYATMSDEEWWKKRRETKLLEAVRMDLERAKLSSRCMKSLSASLFPVIVEKVLQNFEKCSRDSHENEVRDVVSMDARQQLKEVLDMCLMHRTYSLGQIFMGSKHERDSPDTPDENE